MLTFIDDYTLNIDDIKEFWTLLAFAGLHWPLWLWMKFLSKKLAFLVKIKPN